MSKKNHAEHSKEEKIIDFSLNQEETVQEEVEEIKDEDLVIKKSEYEALNAEIESLKDSSLRLQAEFMNYKKRNAKISSEMYASGKEDSILACLVVLDTLDRACEMSNDDVQKEGYSKIQKQFVEILASLNVKEIEAIGKEFDYNLHEAVMQIDKEDAETNQIVAVTLKGYMIGDKVLRHAKVVVAK